MFHVKEFNLQGQGQSYIRSHLFYISWLNQAKKTKVLKSVFMDGGVKNLLSDIPDPLK